MLKPLPPNGPQRPSVPSKPSPPPKPITPPRPPDKRTEFEKRGGPGTSNTGAKK